MELQLLVAAAAAVALSGDWLARHQEEASGPAQGGGLGLEGPLGSSGIIAEAHRDRRNQLGARFREAILEPRGQTR